MGNVTELDKRWITNKDVMKSVVTLEAENKALKEVINDILSIVQRNTTEMTVLKESVQYLTELTVDIKDIATEGTRTTDEIKHKKFIGQEMELLDTAKERVKNITGKDVRKLIHRAAVAHPSGRRKGYTIIYSKLYEITGYDVYEVGKVRLKKSDNISGWSKDPSYINAILRDGYGEETAVICLQILADK